LLCPPIKLFFVCISLKKLLNLIGQKSTMTSFQTLIENFEFEYIFSFLPLKEIVNSQRISKVFKKQLSDEEFWQDVSKIHFKQTLGYKKTIELCKTTSIYIYGYKSEIPTNLSFFNDKRVKKIVPSSFWIYVLTQEGKLYSHNQYDGTQHFYETPNPVEDVACGSAFENQFPKVVICDNTGKAFALESKEGEWKHLLTGGGYITKVEVTEYNTIHTYGDTLDFILLSKKGNAYRYKMQNFKYRSKMENVKDIYPSGYLLNNNKFYRLCEDSEEFPLSIQGRKNGKDTEKNNKKVKYMCTNSNRSIKSNRVSKLIEMENGDISIVDYEKVVKLNIKGEKIVKYFATHSCFFFITDKNNHYVYIPYIHNINHHSHGIKFYQEDMHGQFFGLNKCERLNEFGEIVNIVASENFIVFEAKRSLFGKTKESLESEHLTRMKQFNLEKQEEINQKLTCINCKSQYLESQNSEKSCKFHFSDETFELLVYLDTYETVHKCCLKADEFPCRTRKHQNK
jgi:hypothetical protein